MPRIGSLWEDTKVEVIGERGEGVPKGKSYRVIVYYPHTFYGGKNMRID